jgi:hypothetical protein
MPETTMNKNNLVPTGKNYVWRTRQIGTMQAITVAHGVKQPANRQFWTRVTALYGPHRAATLLD